MSDKISVSAVSYTNTKPFVYGLIHSPVAAHIHLSLDIPATCADKLLNNEVQIGLVPVATLLRMPSYELVSDYCIGALGPVNSVFIFSDKPIEDIQTIRLDEQSRTSNLLSQVLMKHLWKKEVTWLRDGEADAFVEIGDRTFGKKNKYAFAYDLSECWFNLTQLPFVFAAWVSVQKLPSGFINLFNEALAYGINHRQELIENMADEPIAIDLNEYLTRSIDYQFDAPKRVALSTFLELASAL
ncbi:MAG: menaquinone biosynthetic enzyme MqnA/MqnD family protein [Sphingobacteriaceae bacterium]